MSWIWLCPGTVPEISRPAARTGISRTTAGNTYSTPHAEPVSSVTFWTRRGSSQRAAAVASSFTLDWARVRALADPEPGTIIGPEATL